MNRPTQRHPRLTALTRWFVSDLGTIVQESPNSCRGVDILRVLPFIALHLACLSVIWVDWSPPAVGVAVGLYALRMLDRFDILVPALLALTLYGLGLALEHQAPSLGVSGAQLLVWGFVISTIALYHATFAVNSCRKGYENRHYR